MITEGELIPDADHVSLILRVVISEHGKYFDLDLSLLVKLLLVLQYFHGNMLLLRMRVIYAPNDDTESSTAKLLDNFITIVKLICLFIQVVAIFRIETIVEDLLAIDNLWGRILLLGAGTILAHR
jgi:hypothetical protein